jgi:hypothetical protein
MAATSGNNVLSMAGVAMLPAAILTTVNLVRAVERAARPSASRHHGGLLPPALTISLLLFCQNGPYKDAALRHLTARMPAGPFRGLYTTPGKVDFYRELDHDIARFTNPTGRILFYEQFPAGYLMTSMRPALPMLWISCVEGAKRPCMDAYERHFDPRNLVVRMKRAIFRNYFEVEAPAVSRRDPFVSLIQHHHKLVVSRENYDIFSQSRVN